MDTDAGEEPSRGAQLSHVQEVLCNIFSYYNGASGCASASMSYQALSEPLLTSMRFQRMALDAQIVDETLTTAKVDLIFHKVCGISPHMNRTQFLDAMVRMSAAKYPGLPNNEAVLQMFNDHLKSFSGMPSGAIGGLDDASLAIVAAARISLQILYEGYYAAELRPANQKSASASQSETQNAFVKMLTDFEVLPELLPKSHAFAVLREVARAKDFQSSVREAILGQGLHCALGRNFTYVHFAVALILVARKCFGDEGVGPVLRLFEWMDSSKGRLSFASLHPGLLKHGTANFRIAPEKASAPPSAERRGSGLGRRGSNRTSPNAMVFSDQAVHSEAGDGRIPAAGQVAAVELSSASAGIDRSELRRLILQVFGHYAAIGDPLNRTNLSSLKFMRFLRDCGLVGSESRESGSTKDHEFSPAERMRSSRSLSVGSIRSTGSMRSAGSGAGTSGRRGTVQANQGRPRNASFISQPRFSVSAAKPVGSDSGLPLRVFPVPIFTQVEADLIFVTASRKDSDSGRSGPAGAVKRTSSVGALGRRGSGMAAKRQHHHLTPDLFIVALQDIALRCFPAMPEEALETFGERILQPLSETLLEVKGQDVSSAAAVMAEPDTAALLEQCQPGLEQIYAHYAIEHAGRKPQWTSEALCRFAEEFSLIDEVSQLPLQKIFRDCTHYESLAGKGVAGEMSFSSFQLALLMISQKIYVGVQRSLPPLDRVIHLFQRLNSIAAGSGGIGTPQTIGQPLTPLIPGLPSAENQHSASSTKSQASNQTSGYAITRTDRRRSSAIEMSWELMMQNAA